MKILLKVALFIGVVIFFTACGGGGSSSSGKVRIMPLGDSITYDDAHAYYDSAGNDIKPAGERKAYRSYLAYDLNDAGISYDFVGSQSAGYSIEPPFDPDNEGHPGWTSNQIADNVYNFLTGNPADVILLHIGTNDHSNSIEGVKRIISEIKRFESDHNMNIKVFVALIINRRFHDSTIDSFNTNLQAYLGSLGDSSIIGVDMRNMLTGSDYLENTHPNESGYKKMADRWFATIVDYLR
jgi:hypothetical protein